MPVQDFTDGAISPAPHHDSSEDEDLSIFPCLKHVIKLTRLVVSQNKIKILILNHIQKHNSKKNHFILK